eukprot:TRINITY_DN7002_c0_g1_i5.p1 TRINITY_DN7002_c0_g1~~TRINITY_DN7002_c0_g1_i5.p1  ORF type:complete len:447 (-),score=52.58 TRINITY_DN7002_c0_g1_i5:584-1924(-)
MRAEVGMKVKQSEMIQLVFLLLISAICVVAGSSVLVLLEDLPQKNSFSLYFDSLKKSGFQLEFKQFKDKTLLLREWGEWHYDHLILFTPHASDFGGKISKDEILAFVDSGRNVVIALDSNVSPTISKLVEDCGVDVDESGFSVYDHFNYAVNLQADHSAILSEQWTQADVILGQKPKGPIAFKGIGQSHSSDSEYTSVVLSGGLSTYSGDAQYSLPNAPLLLAGEQLALVSVVQARSNGRVGIFGSLEMFSNKYFSTDVIEGFSGKKISSTGNAQFCVGVSEWVFKERGVLEISSLRHSLVNSSEPAPESYTVTDIVQVAVDIQEVRRNEKLPYKSDSVQIEYVMLHPYVRATMDHDNKGTYSAILTVPDVYGAFKFVIEHRALGYTYITLVQHQSVRPYRHDQFERFIVAAYPYYASTIAMMLAFFILSIFFLYHREDKIIAKNK